MEVSFHSQELPELLHHFSCEVHASVGVNTDGETEAGENVVY